MLPKVLRTPARFLEHSADDFNQTKFMAISDHLKSKHWVDISSICKVHVFSHCMFAVLCIDYCPKQKPTLYKIIFYPMKLYFFPFLAKFLLTTNEGRSTIS